MPAKTPAGKLQLKGVELNGAVRLTVAENNSIDTCALSLQFATPAPDVVRDTMDMGVSDVRDGSRYTVVRDVSSLASAFPDTLSLVPLLTIPPGCRVALNDQGSATDSTDNTIALTAHISYRLGIPLRFSIVDTAQVVIDDSLLLSAETEKTMDRIDVSSATLRINLRKLHPALPLPVRHRRLERREATAHVAADFGIDPDRGAAAV